MNISLTFVITIVVLAALMLVWEIMINRIAPINLQGKIVIYGAGKTGLALAGRILENRNDKNWDFSKFEIVGFIDDDPQKEGIRIHNSKETKFKVFGDYKKLDELIKNERISAAVVAIGNPDRLEHINEVVSICKKNHVNCYQFDFKLTKII